MGDLLDVNVWVALSLPTHPLHPVALAYWNDDAAETLVFCRTTALGLVRVCGSPTMSGALPLNPAKCWEALQRWRTHPGVSFLGEAPGIDLSMKAWVDGNLVTSRTWTDAYLAAFAISRGLRLVSFDRDMSRFPGLKLLRLQP